MAKLTIWRADIDRALETSPKVYVGDEPEIHFVEPHTGLNLARANLSWDEVDDLIQQLTAIKPTEKPTGKIEVLFDVLETIENRLGRMPLSSLPLIGKPGPDRDERERLNEERLNLLSEIVKQLAIWRLRWVK